MSTITAGTTSGQAIVVNGDTTGDLVFKTNNTITALTLGTDQSAAFAGNVTVTGSVTSTAGLSSPVIVAGNSSAGAEIRLPEDTDNGTNYVALKAADTLATNLTLTLPAADGTSGQFLQTNGSGVLAFASVPPSGTIEAIATGTLADGSTVVINTDGTVSAVAGVVRNFGSPATAATGGATILSSTYDANAQKVVLAYKSSGTTGEAVVGTVSGMSITFGTPVVFRSARIDSVAIAYNALAQKVVIAYQDYLSGTEIGTAIVGTVSGTSISFGAPVVFNNQRTRSISCAYHVVAQKVVISYVDVTGGNGATAIVSTVSGTVISFGTPSVADSTITFSTSTVYDIAQQKIVLVYSTTTSTARAAVGTVSGTSISFGTPVVFQPELNAIAQSSLSTAYNIDAQKIVIAWASVATSSFGAAIVGTVSGTTISFGTRVIFNSAVTSGITAAYDAVVKKIVICYVDAGSSSFGVVNTGTVSGTSISFDAASIFSSAAISTATSVLYDSTAERMVINYVSTDLLSELMQTGFTNLTAENFIGFSNAAYTNGQTATVQIVGAVDDAQSGLTPAQQYFVQTTGSLGLTADFPSVFAGTAVAANKIIVKG